MNKEEIIKIIKISAFDAITMVSRAQDSYFKRAEVIFDIIIDANRRIRKAEKNG